MKSIMGIGMLIFAAAVPILAAKNKDRWRSLYPR
jgi:hypothetical protein